MSLEERMLEGYSSIVWPVEFKGPGYTGEEIKAHAVKRTSSQWVQVVRDGLYYYVNYDDAMRNIRSDWPILVETVMSPKSHRHTVRKDKLCVMAGCARRIVEEIDYQAQYSTAEDSERMRGARVITLQNQINLLQETLNEYSAA